MSISLSSLHPATGAKKKIKRIGRGNASGHGTTATRGTKGQRARSGGRQGLRTRGMKRMALAFPKMGGFKSKYGKTATITLDMFSAKVPSGAVTPKTFLKLGLVSGLKNGVKIIDTHDFKLEKKYELSGVFVTAAVKEKIEKAGGNVVVKR